MKLSMLSLCMALFLGGCLEEPVPCDGKFDFSAYDTKACQKVLYKGAELSGPPIDRIIVYKKKRELYVYAHNELIDTFPISLGKNADKGPKKKVGDYKTPEGNYKIVRKKCDNRLYRSLMISYPNAEDRAEARKKGLNPGGYITIHGQPKWNATGCGDKRTLSHDWTEGCIAVPNLVMDKLWKAVKKGVKVDIRA